MLITSLLRMFGGPDADRYMRQAHHRAVNSLTLDHCATLLFPANFPARYLVLLVLGVFVVLVVVQIPS